MESYTCINCNKTQTTVVQSANANLFYTYDFKTKKFSKKPDKIEAEEIQSYWCPECSEELDGKTISEVDEFING